MQTNPEQWAFNLATSLPAWFADYDEIALTIQAAFAEREARLVGRINWLANEVMACDYGDNETGQVAWKYHKYDGSKQSIEGASIDRAIDATLASLKDRTHG